MLQNEHAAKQSRIICLAVSSTKLRRMIW